MSGKGSLFSIPFECHLVPEAIARCLNVTPLYLPALCYEVVFTSHSLLVILSMYDLLWYAGIPLFVIEFL